MKNLIQPLGSWSGSQAQSGNGSRFGFAFSAVSLAAALAIGLPFGTQAETIIVPSGSIVTIQDGVDAASPGDTIRVLPGDYNEIVSVKIPRIKLEAETDDSPVRVPAFVIQADDVEVEGFHVESLNLLSAGISVTGAAGVHLSQNTVSSFGGITVSSSSHVHIDHNAVDSKISSAIIIEDSSGTAVDHNVVAGHDGDGIRVFGSSGTHVHQNAVHGGGNIGAVGINVVSSSDGQIDHNTATSSGIYGIAVDGDSCGNSFNGNSAQGALFGLWSGDDPAAPCNRYNNNDADTAFPSLEFWDVR